MSEKIVLSDVRIGAAMHIGARQYQQAALYVPKERQDDELKAKGYLCVLCDGMGGMQGGELASSLCVSKLASDFYDKDEESSEQDFLRNEIIALDEAVGSLRGADGNPLHAGTTLSCAVIKDGLLHWASVGDSHIYIIRGTEMVQVTRDHNYYLELTQSVMDGCLSQAEADQHPQRECLISFVGMGGIKLMDINPRPFVLREGDIVVLCSDGLYRTLSDNEILSYVKSYGDDIELLAHTLIADALDKHAAYQDNMSVGIMGYKVKKGRL